jgi:hypothetical protein
MIETRPSRSYVARAIFIFVLCAGFCVWGAYDLWVAIPRRAQVAQHYGELKKRMDELDASRQSGAPTQAEIDEYTRINDELNAIAPGGKTPSPPSKFDHVVQWIYIACGPFAVMPALSLLRLRRQRYRLDEAGTLHFQGDPILGEGAWKTTEIADIDMHRWMAKSIAWIVPMSGARLKLDAYLHSGLDRIVGSIASRLHPEAWQPDARPVKKSDDSMGAVAADSSEKIEGGEAVSAGSDANP